MNCEGTPQESPGPTISADSGFGGLSPFHWLNEPNFPGNSGHSTRIEEIEHEERHAVVPVRPHRNGRGICRSVRGV